jgi:hypothetical protein
VQDLHCQQQQQRADSQRQQLWVGRLQQLLLGLALLQQVRLHPLRQQLQQRQ